MVHSRNIVKIFYSEEDKLEKDINIYLTAYPSYEISNVVKLESGVTLVVFNTGF